MVRSMLSHADLPNSICGHALLTTAYTLSRVPSKRLRRHHMRYGVGKVFVARTGVFLEKDFNSKGISGRKVELEEIQESQGIDTPMDD
ncbi:hypothetical protein KIW84_055351 [Lathyrus oleraceus]|uniref:Uncharacterized protein n=1 Tax=Pisum sativum TaxID=3888 RepID=A0A9D4X0D5_PEA|nr:hypothetical protein KIW84_055351 [Pisum sativum]